MAGRRRLDPRDGDEGLIGQHLARLVAESGMTVDAFAAKIGKSRDVVTLYFSGTRLPKPKEFRAIAVALGLSNLREVLPDVPLARRRKSS